MRRLLDPVRLRPAVIAAALVAATPWAAQGARPALDARGSSDPERLTVLVVVDQLPASLLERWGPLFTGGFRRLLDEGWSFARTTHDHALTLTAPGHATIATGTFPAQHGVVENAWSEQVDGAWRLIENVVSAEWPLIEDAASPGASPEVMLRSTLAEWLQEAHPEAKVVSLSAKARGAVLLVGHADATVGWFDEGLGRFVGSSWYADAYPEWFTAFNETRMPGFLLDRAWTLEVPEPDRDAALPDSVPWESDGVDVAFPHLFDSVRVAWNDDFWGWWASTPHPDRATRLLAEAAITGGGLGGDDVPDLLAISFSQTDRIGHGFGPTSLEQLDNLLRLDRELAALMETLDREVGAGEWRLALTSDHGVAEVPEAVVFRGGEALRLPTDSAVVLQATVNRIASARRTAERAALAPHLAREIPARTSWIEQGWTAAELVAPSTSVPDSFSVMQRRSHHEGRANGILGTLGVELRYSEGTLLWSYPRGSTHGSPYMYDRHVPFLLLGPDVPAGRDDTPVSTTDIAPTLAALLGIAVPGELDGTARRPGG